VDSELAVLVKKFFEPGGRMESMEKRMTELAKVSGPSDTKDALAKALKGLAGVPDGGMIHGWDGADEAQLVRAHGKACKTIGGPAGASFTDYLLWSGCQTGGAKFKEWLGNYDHPCQAGLRDPYELVNKTMKSKFGAGKGQVRKAPNAEGAGYTGGFLVPPQFYMKLLQFVAEASFVKALCTTLPMQGRELHFPYLNQQQTTPGAAANFPASNFYGGVFFSWEPEASTYPQTNPIFKMGTLVARDLVGITIVSNQLLQDSAIALDSMLTTLFAEALAWQLDYAFLQGNGTNQPLGVLNAPGTLATTRSASNNLLASMATMVGHAVNPNTDKGNYVWVMNQSVLPYLLQLTVGGLTNQILVWSNAFGTGDEGPMARPWPMRIWGIPVYFTEKLPYYTQQGDVCLLDMSKFLCGDRMNIQIEASQFPYFTSNQMVWRTIWRGDGQPWFDNYLTLADGNTTVSPHVVLHS
jgi:HK97 family phage major capsid protein